MSERPTRGHPGPVFLLAALLFVSPLTGWWTALPLPWWAMFVPWALIIALAVTSHDRDEP